MWSIPSLRVLLYNPQTLPLMYSMVAVGTRAELAQLTHPTYSLVYVYSNIKYLGEELFFNTTF
jgi:hypothetical protein